MGQCTARSKRSKEQCLKWAIRGRMTCHMHGGTSKGPTSKAGKERSRKAALKHGNNTKKAIADRKETMALIRTCKDRLRSLGI